MENDSLLLGRIKEIHKLRLIISLPHNKTGICQISAMSEEYESILSRLVNDDTVQNEVAELKKLFKIGQLVQTKLNKSINSNKFDLSLRPSVVNSNINVKRMKSDLKLQVAIKSREDKGYILETGIGGLNGFLPFENCSNANYEIGQLVEVFPILSEKQGKSSRVLNFTTDPALKMTTLSSTETTFDSILPGMLLKTTLKLSSTGFLEGKFNGFPVTVHPDHHRNEEQITGEQTLCVIAMDCALKQLDCSILPHLRPPFKGSADLLSIQIGHSEKNCTIRTTDKGNFTINIPNMKSALGLVTKAHIEPELRKLSQGDSLTARFMDYNLMDNLVITTTLAKLLSQSYFSVHQAKIGEMVRGTVRKLSKYGYAVQISSRLSGLLPLAHISDKQPGRAGAGNIARFKSGDSIQCRVFHVDRDENRLLLTVRKSLMSSVLPVVAGFGDLSAGLVLSGFVTKILEFGLVVALFGNLRGWVPIANVPESQKKSLAISFYIGKPVEVKVLRWEEETNKIILTLNTENNTEEVEEKNEHTVNVGEVYEATIKQAKPNGFTVHLSHINRSAFLPFTQLSDSRQHRSLFQAHYTIAEKSKISVVVITTNDNNIIVAKKSSLIKAAESDRLLTNATKATVGSQWLGWITKKESYGIFVELPTGVKGLVRNKDICDSKPVKIQVADLYEIGDTVEVKVIEIDQTKNNRCLFSLKMSDTYQAADHMEVGALDFLKNHLEERQFLKSTPSCKKVCTLEIGHLVNVEITEQHDWGFTLKVHQQDPTSTEVVAGLLRNQHLPESVVTKASIHRAVIIDIDLGEQTIEVSMAGSLVNAVSNRKTRDCTKVAIGQNISSDVLYFNSDFVLASLKGHAHGNVVYIPTKRFWNDMTREFMWTIKQRNATIIKTALPRDVYIGSLAINEAISDPSVTVQDKSGIVLFKNLAKKMKFRKGETYTAYFHSITKNKLFVCLSQRQKGICNLTEYSESVNELEKLMIQPPEQFSAMDKKFHVTSLNKTTGLVCGNFLSKEVIEPKDLLCCKVVSCYAKNKYRLKLPFDRFGYLVLSRQKSKKVAYTPRIGNIIQCQVRSVSNPSKIAMEIVGSQRLSRDDESVEDEKEVKEEGCDDESNSHDDDIESESDAEEMEIDDAKEEQEDMEEIESNSEENDDEMPIIITRKRSTEESENLSNIYKRIHNSDEEIEDDEDNEEESSLPSAPKQAKITKTRIDTVERELAIRKAEKRRETGENIKNPTNESEFELVLFNQPNDSNSWIKYMKFVMDTDKQVDKVRSIAERAMKILPVRDSDNRSRIMREYIDLEIGELVLTNEGPNYDGQLVRFRKIFERGLAQKPKSFYVYVCEQLLQRQLFGLAEEIAKRFIKEFHHDSLSWFQLFFIRFVQKKFPVVKETITNAERSLKAADFRDLSIRVAQTEIERGDMDRGAQMLISLLEKRPKDGSLKNRIVAIFDKHNLSQYATKLEAISTNN